MSTFVFTLHVINVETNQEIYSEYHNFKEVTGGFIYYRGGLSHPLEIEISRQNATDAMKKLVDSGWTCDNPKILKLWL
jgi:hypothetical protein